MNKVFYHGREINVLYEVDTIVAGGGTAGCVAAIAALDGNCTTLLIEKSISLGGSCVNALVSPMMPTSTERFSISEEIVSRLEKAGCRTCDFKKSTYTWFNPELLSYTLETMIQERQGEILYDVNLIDVIMNNESIDYLILQSIEGFIAVKARHYVDATGDAVLTRLCNLVEVKHGDDENHNQMSSLRFDMGGIDIEKFRSYLYELKDDFNPMEAGDYLEAAMVIDRDFVLKPIFLKGLEDGVLKEEDLRYFQAFSVPNKSGCLSFNCPHLPDLADNTQVIQRSKAILKGHEMIMRLSTFLKMYMPGFEDSYLLQTASMLGVRESYRIVGQYVLSEDDYFNEARFPDGVVKGDWYIDVHSQKNLYHSKKFTHGEYYEIPYRCFVTNEILNLIVVGRCISTTFLMQASVRIQATVRNMGQIAGEACAYANANDIALNAIDGSHLRNI